MPKAIPTGISVSNSAGISGGIPAGTNERNHTWFYGTLWKFCIGVLRWCSVGTLGVF